MDRRELLRRGALLTGAAVLVGVGAEQAGDRLDGSGQRLVARSARPHDAHEPLDTRVVWRGPADGRQRVAMTFDDGPDPRWTPRVLEVLARHEVPATFFVVGSRASAHRDLLRRVVGDGHELGNHTWSHLDLSRADQDRVRRELTRTHETVAALAGAPPAVMRPPWGHIDPVGLLAAAELGYPVVLWSELIRGKAATTDLAAALRTARPGSLLLAHDGGPTPTLAEIGAVDRLIGTLKDRGYDFVRTSDLLADDGPRAAELAVKPTSTTTG